MCGAATETETELVHLECVQKASSLSTVMLCDRVAELHAQEAASSLVHMLLSMPVLLMLAARNAMKFQVANSDLVEIPNSFCDKDVTLWDWIRVVFID